MINPKKSSKSTKKQKQPKSTKKSKLPKKSNRDSGLPKRLMRDPSSESESSSISLSDRIIREKNKAGRPEFDTQSVASMSLSDRIIREKRRSLDHNTPNRFLDTSMDSSRDPKRISLDKRRILMNRNLSVTDLRKQTGDTSFNFNLPRKSNRDSGLPRNSNRNIEKDPNRKKSVLGSIKKHVSLSDRIRLEKSKSESSTEEIVTSSGSVLKLTKKAKKKIRKKESSEECGVPRNVTVTPKKSSWNDIIKGTRITYTYVTHVGKVIHMKSAFFNGITAGKGTKPKYMLVTVGKKTFPIRVDRIVELKVYLYELLMNRNKLKKLYF